MAAAGASEAAADLKSTRFADGQAWLALAAVLGAGAGAAWWLPSAAIDWQPQRAAAEAWRAWTAVFVHWSGAHLAANIAGLLVVAALGRSARLPTAAALAWAAAWPLTHVLLLVMPALQRYGGLSGVLHAGVAVAALWLMVRRRGAPRAIGIAIATGLLVKLLLEAPWGAALRQIEGWDIAIAPLAHATGTVAGLVCASLALAWPSRMRTLKPRADLPAGH